MTSSPPWKPPASIRPWASSIATALAVQASRST
jgi:hypothetical protein